MLRPRELFLGFFNLVLQVSCMLPIDGFSKFIMCQVSIMSEKRAVFLVLLW